MLYILGTPIGNLGDFSPRARETLDRCEYVLCEDTRHSGGLLRHFGIEKRLVSFHMFNERAREDGVIDDLLGGVDVALVSDAGMPCVCDPGADLVRRARSEGVKIEVVPGPCAVSSAVALAGINPPFHFYGYADKRTFADCVRNSQGAAVFYVAPHDVRKVLGWCASEWQVTIAREMTKKFEEVLEGNPIELLEKLHSPKGEMVMIVQGEGVQSALAIDEATLVGRLEGLGVKPREAVRLVAELSGKSQKEIYALAKKD